jgi:NADH-quinone oxidoreductase subunit I
MLGILKGLLVTSSTAFRKPVTRQYPNEIKTLPARNRGLPLLVWDQEHDEPYCIGCRQCDDICPVRCITVIGPVDNARYPAKEHDAEACAAERGGACPHNSPRRTLPDLFFIDEDRCMRCGLCEAVCPTDQERYGYQKAIVVGTGHLSIQASVFDRNDNVLDLDALTYHSRILGLELNAITVEKPPASSAPVNTDEMSGLRLSSRSPIPIRTRLKAGLLRMYAPLWLARRGLPQKGKPDAGNND